jgi:hypothetical protein
MVRGESWIGRKDRHSVVIEAVVYRDDGSKMNVKLANVSDEGCRVEGVENLGIGERIRIAISRMGEVKAQVRWSFGESAGARFSNDCDV